jgi:hypothetical protein
MARLYSGVFDELVPSAGGEKVLGNVSLFNRRTGGEQFGTDVWESATPVAMAGSDKPDDQVIHSVLTL